MKQFWNLICLIIIMSLFIGTFDIREWSLTNRIATIVLYFILNTIPEKPNK